MLNFLLQRRRVLKILMLDMVIECFFFNSRNVFCKATQENLPNSTLHMNRRLSMMSMKKNLLQKRREDMTTVLVSELVFGFVLESSAKSSSKEYSTLLDAHIAMAQAVATRTMTTKDTTIMDTTTDRPQRTRPRAKWPSTQRNDDNNLWTKINDKAKHKMVSEGSKKDLIIDVKDVGKKKKKSKGYMIIMAEIMEKFLDGIFIGVIFTT